MFKRNGFNLAKVLFTDCLESHLATVCFVNVLQILYFLIEHKGYTIMFSAVSKW